MPRKKVLPKRLGRPATGRDPVTAIRLAPELVKEIDAWALSHGVSRSEAIRSLVENALAAQSALRAWEK
jgi:metal-responsive CopG/Arc/MetJ family transcriptional regulator